MTSLTGIGNEPGMIGNEPDATPLSSPVSAFDVGGPTGAVLPAGQSACWVAQGDVLPGVQAQLVDGEGRPVSLAGSVVTFRLRTLKRALSLVAANAVVTDPDAGRVTYPWAVGDTADAGDFLGAFHVVFEDGTTLTFPSVGSIPVRVSPN